MTSGERKNNNKKTLALVLIILASVADTSVTLCHGYSTYSHGYSEMNEHKKTDLKKNCKFCIF